MIAERVFGVKRLRYAHCGAVLVEAVATVVQPWSRHFYLLRGDAEWASDRVSPEAYEICLEAIGGFVYVGTSMDGRPTDVRVEVHDTEPLEVAAEADRVVDEPTPS